MTTKAIDTDRISPQLRARGIDVESRELLITRFDGSEQEQDFSEPSNCAGLGRVRHFHRQTSDGWPDNTLPIDPAARALGISPSPDILRAQVFQNAVCNWRCWYCYVDFPLLSGNRDHADMRSADELVELYRQETSPPAVIDLTGGQPDLVPEWVPWMIDALSAQGLGDRVYLWSDDNLSNDYFFTKLTAQQRAVVDGYSRYGKVCCFKGFDSPSFAFNTAAAPELFERQFELMGRLLRETRIDIYAYATFTTPEDQHIGDAMANFIDRLQALDRNLPLRLVPLQIAAFTPTQPRMQPEHHRALAIQESAIAAWNAELSRRFIEAELDRPICDVSLQRD
jgi:uncharacterized Fe-S cluster-containing radical SAM superfamily protein